MRNRFALRVMFAVLVGLALVLVGGYAYNLGVVHGIAESSRVAEAPGASAPIVGFWPRPWGFGFGLFPFFLLVFVWALIFRGLYWRGAWGCGYGYRSPGVPPAFDEWHRRAHEQQAPPNQSRQ